MDQKFLKALESVPPQPLRDLSRFWKGWLYGELGVGKTITAIKCVEKRGLLVTTDTGSDSVFNHPELLDKVEIVPYDGLTHLTAIGQATTEKLKGYAEFDTVIVDTVSQVAEEYLDFLNDNFSFRGNLREKATPKTGAPRGLHEQEVIGLPDYRLLRDNLRTPIKTLIKAPVNVMFLSHSKDPSFMATGLDKLMVKPNIPEATYLLIGREVSFLGMMERDGEERFIKFQNDRKTVAKSRIKALDNLKVNANDLPNLLATWKGSL